MTGSFEDPDVKLLKVEVVKARLLEQEFVMRFRIDNPNDFSLPVRGLQYTVQLNDIQLAEGESGQWFTVPAHGHEVFDVPVRTNLWRHMKYIVKLLRASRGADPLPPAGRSEDRTDVRPQRAPETKWRDNSRRFHPRIGPP